MSAKGSRKHLQIVRETSWHFCLYVADETPRSLQAIENLNRFCSENFPGKFTIEVIDVLAHPTIAMTENIIALPTLVKKTPKPMRKVIGDLSNRPTLTASMDVPVER